MELRLSLDVIVLGEENTFLNHRNKGVLCVFVCAQSCLTLRDPMDHGPPGSSVHGIFQTRILKQLAISFSELGVINP